ncbi:MAG TPA: hypothetical protein DCZ95_01750 [Verrucomicrobia bacterium]|nr:MAG: hypothetical protein A2X46_08515 [Lentisphaerae bacterium GWF2_57_35]HBA82794.1 hypothetical protein [Verrucomicrobiota bacterium]
MKSFYGCMIAGSLALLFAANGCMSIKQPYIEKRQYVLEAKRPGDAVPTTGTALLKVRPFVAAPLCEGSSFVYRLQENRYAADFYHVFLIPVNNQLTEIQRQWLAQAGFPTAQSSSRLDPLFILENTLLTCRGDYRNPAHPLAIVEIETALVDNRNSPPQLVFQKTYCREILLKKASPDELVRGWNEALAGILTELESDLQNQKELSKAGAAGPRS